MSLVGSLEDLGLGDILQIITLSRKSGTLCLRSGGGEGRVVFRDGLVCGAHVKGRTPDLRGLLVDGGALDAEGFEAAREAAGTQDVPLAAVLAEALGAERFEGLRRECVERAVLEMFGWETGEFSFEVGDEGAGDDFEVVLDTGVNAQYLAMEGTRRSDEESRLPAADSDDVASFADLAEEISADADDERCTVAATEDGPGDAYEAVALTTAERLGEETDPPWATAAGPPGSGTEDAVARALEDALDEAADGVRAAEPALAAAGRLQRGEWPPLVLVDPDLAILEWAKKALDGVFPRIHIFQHAELAVQRLRQYGARGELPLVLVSPAVPVDRTSGVADVDEWVARLKRQAPRQRVLWLCDRASRGQAAPADGLVHRPDPAELAGRHGGEAYEAPLRNAVLAGLDEAPHAAAGPADRLEAIRARLDDPATRGEILNVVLGFAAEHVSRVALFMVREGTAWGLAQVGLPQAGGPDDSAVRGVRMAVEESAWLRTVVGSRSGVRAPAAGPGDRELAARLGRAVPAEAWLAPVVSGEQVVAILYGDTLPAGGPLPDTADLETALAHAGRALEQAARERARDEAPAGV